MPGALYFDSVTQMRPTKDLLKTIWSLYDVESFPMPLEYGLDREVFHHIVAAYDDIQSSLGVAKDSSCVITASYAEAASQAIASLFHHGVLSEGKNHLAIAQFHDLPTTMAAYAKKEYDVANVSLIPANHLGVLTAEAVVESITPRTAVVAFPLVHPLLGTIQPLEEIYEITRSRAIPLLVDVSCALGTTMIDLTPYDNIYYLVRGETLGLPRGLGSLLVRTPHAPQFSPLIYGDEHPFIFRGGPLNVPGLIGLSEVFHEIKRNEMLYCTEVNRLRRSFEEKLTDVLGKEHVIFPFEVNENMAPHISCMIFRGVKNEAMLYQMVKKNMFATLGGNGFQHISDVLKGIGLPMVDAFSALSFSFSHETKESEIEEAVKKLASIYRLLRKISPYQESV